MEGRLAQAHAGNVPRGRAVHRMLHQAAADALVLHGGIHRDRTEADNSGALVEEVAADDSSVPLGHYAVEERMSQQHADEARSHFRRGKVVWEAVGGVDGAESVETDASAGSRVIGRGA